jgi:hypothetical protein
LDGSQIRDKIRGDISQRWCVGQILHILDQWIRRNWEDEDCVYRCQGFFCSRDDAASSNPKLIFTTIAYQLGRFCLPFGDKVAGVVKLHPDIGYSDLSYQLEQLIINPLLEIGDSFPPWVVVIDTLDECKNDKTTSLILASLSRYIN